MTGPSPDSTLVARAVLAGRFALLVIAVQFWTLKAGFLSLAMVAFIGLSLTRINFRSVPKTAYLLGIAAILSYAASERPQDPGGFHYSVWFSLSTLLILGAFVNWSVSLRGYGPGKDLSPVLFAGVVLCVLGIALLTPIAFIEQVDGPVGFFNEKGLAGYYVASISCLLLVVRRDLIGFIAFVLCAFLSLVILESGRSLLFYAATALLVLERASLRWRVALLGGAAIAAMLIVNTEFFAGQLHKLDLIAAGEGGLGRYAAAKIVSEIDWSELLIGHGYGSYLAFRADLLPLPEGLEYDYGGSLWLELVFEIGLVGTAIAAVLVTRLLFRRTSFLAVSVVVLLGTIGVKHDVQMLTAFLCAQVISQALAQRGRVPRGARSSSSFTRSSPSADALRH